jgi:hypothetical protein
MAAIPFEDGAGGGADWPGGGVTTGCVFKIAPMMKNVIPIPMADMNNEALRPRLSTKKNTKSVVAKTFTIPYIPEAKRELVVPEYPI